MNTSYENNSGVAEGSSSSDLLAEPIVELPATDASTTNNEGEVATDGQDDAFIAVTADAEVKLVERDGVVFQELHQQQQQNQQLEQHRHHEEHQEALEQPASHGLLGAMQQVEQRDAEYLQQVTQSHDSAPPSVVAAPPSVGNDSRQPSMAPPPSPPLEGNQGGQQEEMKKNRRSSGKKRVRRVGATIEPTMAAPGLETARSTMATPFQNIPPRGQSKHDDKWLKMLEQLIEYKKANNSTLVPQCYDQDPRLGRWVHYQRVEYWTYQSTGKGKTNPDRIARLNSIGFEWDPQRAQWNMMYKKLQNFAEEHGHCKVPKGYTKDPELANWVRNQRLEYTNLQRGKKTRMTEKRLEKLNQIGFKWSTTMPRRKKNPQGGNSEGTNNNNNDVPPNAVGTSRKAETLTAVVAVQQESLALSARTIADAQGVGVQSQPEVQL